VINIHTSINCRALWTAASWRTWFIICVLTSVPEAMGLERPSIVKVEVMMRSLLEDDGMNRYLSLKKPCLVWMVSAKLPYKKVLQWMRLMVFPRSCLRRNLEETKIPARLPMVVSQASCKLSTRKTTRPTSTAPDYCTPFWARDLSPTPPGTSIHRSANIPSTTLPIVTMSAFRPWLWLCALLCGVLVLAEEELKSIPVSALPLSDCQRANIMV
jgi:hypothetical protein